MEKDPQELVNLAGESEFTAVKQNMIESLHDILDPEKVNALAFADQNKMIDKLGGLETIREMQSFNHTPLE